MPSEYEPKSPIGSEIRSDRKALGMTQAQLAQRLGVDQAAVSAWEAAGVMPTDDNRRALAALFGWSAEKLGRLLYPELDTAA